MAHKKIIDSVKKQGQVTIKDLDEFLRFVINEYDMRTLATYENLTNFRKVFVERLVISKERMNEIKQYTDGGKKQNEIEFESVTFADGMCMDVRCIPRKNGPSWCEAAIYYADEDVVTSEPYNSFYNHWVCQTANATYHLYMGVADTE